MTAQWPDGLDSRCSRNQDGRREVNERASRGQCAWTADGHWTGNADEWCIEFVIFAFFRVH